MTLGRVDDKLLGGAFHLEECGVGRQAGGGLGHDLGVVGDTLDGGEHSLADDRHLGGHEPLRAAGACFLDQYGAEHAADDRADHGADDAGRAFAGGGMGGRRPGITSRNRRGSFRCHGAGGSLFIVSRSRQKFPGICAE